MADGLTLPALSPHERVLVVYNANDADSLDVANYYMARRNIPATHKCAISASSTDEISWAEFVSSVKRPVADCLDAVGRQNILYVVFSYHTPYKIAEGVLPSISINYPTDGD